jgi:hypothetical protein
MKVSGITVMLSGKENSTTSTEISMKVNGSIIKLMVLEYM